jgi:CheY-like chemotaxis protein
VENNAIPKSYEANPNKVLVTVHNIVKDTNVMNGTLDQIDSVQTVRVLVVEDNPDDQEMLQRQLRKASIGNVIFLSNPRLALEWLQGPSGEKLRRELVALFLDVDLPYMTGIELLKIIRLMEGMQEIPVMVMTSSAKPETIAACHELKVRAFVEKPVTFHDFSKVIAPLFHQSLKPVSVLTAERNQTAPTGNESRVSPQEVRTAHLDLPKVIRNLPTLVFRCL